MANQITDNEFYISFTRNKNFYKEKRDLIPTDCCLAFDGNKLSNKYKISPVNFYATHPNRELKNDEMEERIVSNKWFSINIEKYILYIKLIENEILDSGQIEFGDMNLMDTTSTTISLNNAPEKIKYYIEQKYKIKTIIE
jgi:hypothetical protein